ncbi:MAG: hypothetical protein JWM10_2575 [Myxococcaceae bacterium]|nr:hypothetical protein [Myxococcaceae bacterium]
MRRPAALLAALSLGALPSAAAAQDRSPWLPPPALEQPVRPLPPPGVAREPEAWQVTPPRPSLPPFMQRPVALPAGMVTLNWGAGFAFSSIPSTSSFTRNNTGLGLAFDLSAGLGKHLQLDFGTGLRFSTLLAADRYGRVLRDDVFQTGNRFVGNPWVKLRYAILDGATGAFGVGVEALVQLPFAEASAWSVGAGVPLQWSLPAWRLRFETGVFMQFVLSDGSTIRNVLNVPLRVLVAAGDTFAVGLITGVQVGNAFRDDATEPNVQFGIALRARINATVELSGQWLMPAVSPVGLDAYGLGFAVTHRVR